MKAQAAMVASAVKRARRALKGRANPRISPPRPARSDLAAFVKTAEGMGITLMPWQKVAGRYLTARGPGDTRLYRDIAIEVSRQNGKTTLMEPFIIGALRDGKKVMHIAQSRELPRHMFGTIADALSAEPELFPKRRGKTIWPRYGAGQEEIVLQNGGTYRIAASRTGGARGWSNDIVIIDEVREIESFDIINAAEPTLMMSPDPLMVYLSNAGSDKSIVLKSIEERAGADPGLAYLEWSAPPGLDAGDRHGWEQANPALGHNPSVQSYLESAYERHRLAGTMAIFETEHLCRSVATLLPPVVSEERWEAARGSVSDGVPNFRPYMAVKVDPEGRRASVVIAWNDGKAVYLRSFAEDITAPLDLDALAADLLPLVRKYRVSEVAYDPWTDRALVRHFPTARAVNGQEYQAACRSFAEKVEGRQIIHADDGTITDDLGYTVRREAANGWYAVRAGPERATTAGEAAIRAAWLASAPRKPRPQVY